MSVTITDSHIIIPAAYFVLMILYYLMLFYVISGTEYYTETTEA